MKNERGFTLIEIMLVVVIIAVLASIALPAYSKYQNKSKVAAAIAESSALKTPFDILMNQGVDVTGINDLAGSGVTQNCNFTVAGVGSAGVGTIVCTITNGSSAVNGQSITWTRGSDAHWSCSSTVAAELLPIICSSS